MAGPRLACGRMPHKRAIPGKKQLDKLRTALAGDVDHMSSGEDGSHASERTLFSCCDADVPDTKEIRWTVCFNGQPKHIFPKAWGNCRIYSSDFTVGGVAWNIIMQASDEERALGLFLNCVDTKLSDECKIHAACELTVFNANSHLDEVKAFSHAFDLANPDWGFKDVLANQSLRNPALGFVDMGTCKEEGKRIHSALQIGAKVRVLKRGGLSPAPPAEGDGAHVAASEGLAAADPVTGDEDPLSPMTKHVQTLSDLVVRAKACPTSVLQSTQLLTLLVKHDWLSSAAVFIPPRGDTRGGAAELERVFDKHGLAADVCKRVCDELGARSASDLRFIEPKDLDPLTWLSAVQRFKILNLATAALEEYAPPAIKLAGLRQTRYTVARSSTAGHLKRLILSNLLAPDEIGQHLLDDVEPLPAGGCEGGWVGACVRA